MDHLSGNVQFQGRKVQCYRMVLWRTGDLDYEPAVATHSITPSTGTRSGKKRPDQEQLPESSKRARKPAEHYKPALSEPRAPSKQPKPQIRSEMSLMKYLASKEDAERKDKAEERALAQRRLEVESKDKAEKRALEHRRLEVESKDRDEDRKERKADREVAAATTAATLKMLQIMSKYVTGRADDPEQVAMYNANP